MTFRHGPEEPIVTTESWEVVTEFRVAAALLALSLHAALFFLVPEVAARRA